MTTLRELTGRSAGVVNTHRHHDHCFGNHVFRRQRDLGPELCADDPRARASRARGSCTTRPDRAEMARGRLHAARPDVRGARRDRGRRAVRSSSTISAAAIPTTTSSSRSRRPASCSPATCSRTAPPPYFGDGYPLDWPATVEALIGLGATRSRRATARWPIGRSPNGRSRRSGRSPTSVDRWRPAGCRSTRRSRRPPYKPKASREPIERAAAQARGELD